MARRKDWSVVVALVGGGQEINDGEAGLEEWGRALVGRQDWKIYASPSVLEGDVSVAGHRLFESTPEGLKIQRRPELHLSVGLRAPRARGYSMWVEHVLRQDPDAARTLAAEFKEFPIRITRSLELAKAWLRGHCDSRQRMGLVASSANRRLRLQGIQLSTQQGQNRDIENWFLAPLGDVRSSNSLEIAAIEFECQGLELDWVGLCWGDDFTSANGRWQARNFIGTTWRQANDIDARYAANTYRVLLTRARQGLVIFVPVGDFRDPTREPPRMDATHEFLISCGAVPLSPPEPVL